jgi:hypothetical protein
MSWDFQFLASNPKGEQCQIFEYGTEPGQDLLEPLMPILFKSGGLVLPVLLRLPAGHRRAIFVSLRVEQRNLEGAEMGNRPPPAGHLWTGELHSRTH